MWRIHPRLATAVLALFLLVGLTACSSGAGSSDAAATDSADESTNESVPEAEDESTAGAEADQANEPADTDDGETFDVLALLPNSGPLAFVGTAETNAMRAAADVINAEGGILGAEVVVESVDTAADGTQAISALQEALDSDTTWDLIIPGIFAEARALVPVLADVPILQISIASAEDLASDVETYPYWFTTGTGFPPNADGLAARMVEEGFTTVAAIQADNVAGQEGALALENAFADAGLDLTVVLAPEDAVDVTPQLQQAMDTEPQALITSALSPIIGPLLQARATLGIDVPLYGDAFAGAADFAAIADPASLDGVLMQTAPYLVQGHEATQSAEFQAFYDALHVYEDPVEQALLIHQSGYATIMLARGAAIAAGSVEGPAMAEALVTLSIDDIPGYVGPSILPTPELHRLSAAPEDFIYVSPGSREDGLIIPGDS